METFFVSLLVDAGGTTFFEAVDADDGVGVLAGFFVLVTAGILAFDF